MPVIEPNYARFDYQGNLDKISDDLNRALLENRRRREFVADLASQREFQTRSEEQRSRRLTRQQAEEERLRVLAKAADEGIVLPSDATIEDYGKAKKDLILNRARTRLDIVDQQREMLE